MHVAANTAGPNGANEAMAGLVYGFLMGIATHALTC